jgi:LacI family transcriptional regulator
MLLRCAQFRFARGFVTARKMTIAAPKAEPEAEPPDTETRGRLTINDIARLAEVSKKTVSRVINKSLFVKVETRERVEAVIRQYGYVPDLQARGLAFRRSFLVGMIYDNPSPQYVVNMQQGILDALSGTGFELVIRPVNRNEPSFLKDMRTFVERQKLFGVILPPSVSEDERLARLLEDLECPYVRIASVQLDKPARMILTHDHLGGAAAARRLAELGHRRIAHISGPALFRSAYERRRGFIEGLSKAGLELAPEFSKEGAYTYESGLARGTELLSMTTRPTAIFAGNDEMAAGVYGAAREIGLRIPEDLSVVGYDDAPGAARLWPPLTSVRLPIREMGSAAAEKLFAEREGRSKMSATEFTPSLIERQSTALWHS